MVQAADGTITYTPSSALSSLVIATRSLTGNTFSAISFDLGVDATATVLLVDSLTGRQLTLRFPPARQRITLEATSLTSLPLSRRRHLSDEATRNVTLTILESPPSTPLTLSNVNLVTASPTTAPSTVCI